MIIFQVTLTMIHAHQLHFYIVCWSSIFAWWAVESLGNCQHLVLQLKTREKVPFGQSVDGNYIVERTLYAYLTNGKIKSRSGLK